MECISKEQITQVALGREKDAALDAHVEQCPMCQASVSALRSMTEPLAAAHARFDLGHETARARLLALLEKHDGPALRPRVSNRVTYFSGALTMKQRIAVGSGGLAAMLCFLLLWATTKPTSAIAQMAENIRRAKSFKATTVFEHQFIREPGKPPITAVSTITAYWLAPGSSRSESKADENWLVRDEWTIQPAGKPGISIDHQNKRFRRTPARLEKTPSLSLDKFDELARFSGQADRELGTREINGHRASGFEIDSRKIDPDGGASGRVEVWLDHESHLPVLFKMEMEVFGKPATYTIRDFQWNIDLDPKLFEPTPPEGYADATTPPPALEKQVRLLTDGLRTYGELSGGHYPPGKMVYGDVTWDEMLKMIGITGQPTPEQTRSEAYQKIQRVQSFCPTINGILSDNPDAAYHGKTVGPNDANKVLLRWQLEDGGYQVIFGDLRTEIVSKERLGKLEQE